MNVILKDGLHNMDFEKITKMLAESFWSPGIKIGEVVQAAAHSALVVGAFLEDGAQIGYGRVISDKTRFAYLTDFYVDGKFRKQGIGQQLVDYVLHHAELKDVYQWLLITRDAHGVYKKLGFESTKRPLDYMEIKFERPAR